MLIIRGKEKVYIVIEMEIIMKGIEKRIKKKVKANSFTI